MFDYLIIGAGVIGSAVARELSKYNTKTICVEKENDVANVQSLANSAIIHSGYNTVPGTLKAILSIEGNKLYEQWHKELEIPLLRTGAFVVAHGEEEEKEVYALFENAKKVGVKEAYILSLDEAQKLEPNLADSITQVLSLPSTMVTYPWEVAHANMENAVTNGVIFKKNAQVTSIKNKTSFYEVQINNQEVIKTKNIINAAGVASDDIGKMIEEPPFKINGRKGEYFVLDKRVEGFIKHVIYPVPSDKGKGVLITPQWHGNILLGPSSEWVEDKHRVNTTKEGLAYVKEHAVELAKNIPFNQIIRSFAGVRSSSDYEDFYIKESSSNPGFYYLGGIDSPGLTAAPAIAKYLVEEVIKIKASFNPSFNPIRKRNTEFYRLPSEEQEEKLKVNKLYGNIICKCEKITEQEVMDAIHSAVGADSVKSIKKRIRAGAGLCQGGYCEEKVIKILARELNKKMTEVDYDKPGSAVLIEETKGSK